MQILLYTDSDVFAGTERHMLDLGRALRDLGQSVTFACPEPEKRTGHSLAERGASLGFPILAIPKTGMVDRNAIRILAEQLRENKIDVIHAHNGRTHIAAAFALKKAGRGACVATQHFLSPTRTSRKGLKAFVANVLHYSASKYTAHTIAISDAVRNAALARDDCPPDKITTVYNGIYPPEVPHRGMPLMPAPPAPPGVPTLRYTLKVAANAPLVFCAARLQPEKDLATLIAAMKFVHEKHPTARCLIAGDGPLLGGLQTQIDSLNLQEAVTLLGFRNDVANLLDSSDMFVLPSLAEPFGLALVEAMALGKAVIATNTGGPAEIVEHPTSGLLVPPSDAAALAAAIHELLADPARRTSVAEAGHKRYLSHFTAPRMAAEILKIYASAVGRPAAASAREAATLAG